MSQEYSQHANESKTFEQNQPEITQSAHRSLARRSQQQRLIDQTIRRLRGEAIEPRGHLEIVLSRIRPEPTPLYEIQQNPTGKGFVSDPQARIHYLREKFGFNISNSIDRSTKPARSFYWLILNDAGTAPKMNAIEYREEKTGKPKATVASATPANQQTTEPPLTLTGSQTGLFADMPATWRDPDMEAQR